MTYRPPKTREDLKEQTTEDLREMLVDDLMFTDRGVTFLMETVCMSPLIHVDSEITRRDILSELESRVNRGLSTFYP